MISEKEEPSSSRLPSTETTTPPPKAETEEIYEGILQVFKRMQARFIRFDRETIDENTKPTLDRLSKLASSVSYVAQTHAGLAKAYKYEQRLADIEDIVSNLPPEILHEIMVKKQKS